MYAEAFAHDAAALRIEEGRGPLALFPRQLIDKVDKLSSEIFGFAKSFR